MSQRESAAAARLAEKSHESSQPSSLGHVPEGKWKFDESVAAVFDDMLARSIPQINAMREAVFQLACRFVQPGTDIVDLGCAIGEAMAPLLDQYRSSNHFVGIEASLPMVSACRNRFQKEIAEGAVDIHLGDLRNSYPGVKASVTLSILTLMFTPIEHRFRIVGDIFEHTVPGGVLIFAEKILAADARTDSVFVDLYYAHKRAMGYSQEEIDRKRLSLEGVLVPVTAQWNEELLRSAGFRHIECFWRYLNFCGWIAVKV